MAENQPTLFDLDMLPGMVCHKPTKKYPDGRTGTVAGYIAHSSAKESPCSECHSARQEYRQRYRADNRELVKQKQHDYYQKVRERVLKEKKEYYAENREEMLELERIYRDNNRERLQEYQRQWYSKNREKVTSQKRESNKKWYDANPERVRARRKAYRESSCGKVATWERENAQRRRALKRALPSDGYSIDDLTRTHGTVCYLCETEVDINLPMGTRVSPEIDHVHPLSHPDCPGDVLPNVRWTHKACNSSKGPKLVSELELPFPAPC